MKVFCSYDSKYDCFFKQLVEYVLERYGDALDISSVREIELVKEIDGIDPPDGRLVENGKKILIAERKIRELPHLNIAQLGGEESFKSVVETLYHEMGHATDMVNMPSMYACVFAANASIDGMSLEAFATLLFLEYVSQQRTSNLAIGEYATFCDQIASGLWNKYENHDSHWAFLYVSKLLVYFIIKANVLNKKIFYLEKAKEPLLSEYALALEEALNTVYARLPFDDCDQCVEIVEVMRKYEIGFKGRYAPEK